MPQAAPISEPAITLSVIGLSNVIETNSRTHVRTLVTGVDTATAGMTGYFCGVLTGSLITPPPRKRGEARTELEFFLKEQPENYILIGYLALTNMGLGDKAAAFTLTQRAMAAIPVEKDPSSGPFRIEILARVAARMGEPERAIAALQTLLSIPYDGGLSSNLPLTPALLRLDPMFDPLRNDPRFQALALTATK